MGRGLRDNAMKGDFAEKKLFLFMGEAFFPYALYCVLLLEFGQCISGTIDGSPASLAKFVGEHVALPQYKIGEIGKLFGVHGNKADGSCR